MGLPHSGTFANIFLCHHEKQWLADCPPHFAPTFYKRYIDDTFILFNDSTHASLFLHYLNSKHPNIKFTHECEKNGKLSFLDTEVFRENNKFVTTVFRKPTFSGLGLSYFSFCSFKFKLNAIKTLLYRSYHICHNYLSMHEEFNFLRNFFHSNGFPSKLIENTINKFLCKTLTNSQTCINENSTGEPLYFCIPYNGNHSEKLKKDLLTLLHKYFPSIQFHAILMNKFSINSFFSYKDRLPKAVRSSVIYKFSCEQCSSGYVGSTTRSLLVRVSEHAGRSHRTGSRLTSPPASNIRDHAEVCGSPITLQQFSILSQSNNNLDIRILESLYIYKQSPTINSQQSAHPLYLVNN